MTTSPRPMPFVPACRLFATKRDELIALASHAARNPGIANDLWTGDVEVLGLFTTMDRARPEILLRIVREVKRPRVVVLGVTIGKDRRGVVVKDRELIDWSRWCGDPSGVPGTLHGDHASEYERKRLARTVEYTREAVDR